MVKLGKNARSVSIVGVGCTPFKDFETHPETQGIGEGEAFGYAALEAIADAGLEPRDVDFFYHGSANPYLVGDCITPNMQVADWIGMRAKGSVHHSEACCTGYVALEQAVMAVASGTYDVVLSGACDLASTLPVEHQPSHIRQDFPLSVMIPSLDKIYDRAYGRPLDGAFGVSFDNWINEYSMQYDIDADKIDDALNGLTKSLRRGAVANPLAWYETTVEQDAAANGFETADEYLKSMYNPKVTQYLRVTGNAPSADGAACCIVCPTEMASQFKQKPIEVLGIGASCLESMVPHLEKKATAEAARQVYETTGVKPEDLDLLLINDFILSSQLLAAEEVGYLPKGEGWKYVMEGRTAFDGDKPINTNGGRTSYGHAFGASGMADVYEAVLQMRGQAGEHQVKKLPKTTILRGFGGGQNVRISILRTVE